MNSKRTAQLGWLMVGMAVLMSGCQGRRDWTRAQTWDDIPSYEWFIEQYPESRYTEQAQQRLADLYWQETLARDKLRQPQPKQKEQDKGLAVKYHNAIQAYNTYIQRFMDTKYTGLALARLDTLYWQEARLMDRIQHYQQYITRHPRSPFATQAVERLAYIQQRAVVFSDPVLEARVRQRLNHNQGKEHGEILQREVQNIRSLDLWLEPQIERLEGLQHCINLTYLRLPYQAHIKDWSSLAGLRQLQELIIVNNGLDRLDFIAGLHRLKTLNLEENQVTDLGPLSQLKALEVLNLSRNQLRHLGPLKDLHRLRVLKLYKNEIASTVPLQGLTDLQEIWLGENKIDDIGPLSGLKNVRIMRLENNQISDLRPLYTGAPLRTLNLANNRITRINAIDGLRNMEYLNLAGNQLEDISAFKKIKKIGHLNLSANLIYDLEPLIKIEVKEELLLSDNKITDISPLLLNPSLLINQVRINLKNNPLSSATADRLNAGRTTGQYTRWQW